LNDFWDPNTWVFEDHRRLWCPHIRFCALLDEEDWHVLSKWKWNIKSYRGRPYFRRAVGNSKHGPGGVNTVYLHLEVARRARLRQLSAQHIFIDHINHDSLDNRRSNLRWVTRKENAENIKGVPFWVHNSSSAKSISARSSAESSTL
jgi:hypothetical protein